MKTFFLWSGRQIAAYASWSGRVLRSGVRRTWALVVAVWRARVTRAVGRTALSTVRVALWTALISGVVFAAAWAGYRHVPPGFVGVRQHNFGGDGIELADLGTGLHFAPRLIDELHLVDGRTQLLAFAWESEGGEHPMLEVRTKDGSVAQVGVAVPYRVKPGEAAALVRDGLKHAWKLRVKSTVEKVLLQEFGAFTFQALTTTDERLAVATAALPRLNAALEPLHVEAERILITHVFFGLEFEKKLQQTQLSRQTALMLDATTALEQQRHETKVFQDEIDLSERKIRSALDDEIQKTLVEGQSRIMAVYAEAKEYDRERRNTAQTVADQMVLDGELALLRAEQEREELQNEIHDSAGGRMMLAKQAAENLNIRQVTLNSNDPRVPSVLDLNELTRLFVAGAR